jgi:hypothetical protein
MRLYQNQEILKGVLDTIDKLHVIIRAFICAILNKHFKLTSYSQKI